MSYTADERKMIDRIKIAAWSRIEKEFPDEVNVPLVIATLFWEFPEIFGDKIKKWIDALEDKVIVLLPEEVTVKGRALTYRYAYLMETEIRNAR